MDSITLQYTSDSVYQRTYRAIVHGADAPDQCRFFGFNFDHGNGDLSTATLGMARIITIDFPPLTNADDREFLANFMCCDELAIIYKGSTIAVVKHENKLQSRWVRNISFLRAFTIVLDEVGITNGWPGSTIQPTSIIVGYTFSNVEIAVTSTEDSPETLRTSTGKLSAPDSGATLPVFDSDTHIFGVKITSLQSCAIFPNSEGVTEDGGDLVIKVFHADYGQTQPGGALKCNIELSMEAK